MTKTTKLPSSVLAYNKMTRAERRVAIAKDVIKNLELLKVKSKNGYVVAKDPYIIQGNNSMEIAESAKKICKVCAKGAMMICKISKFNNYEFNNNRLGYVGDCQIYDALKDAFSQSQLNKIEECFEMWSENENIYMRNWIDLDDNNRLRAIMQSIIDHKGIFKPNVKYEVVTV